MNAPYVSRYVKTAPKPVTKEKFHEMLEVLPPCRWNRGSFVEFFHVSERLSGNLVAWFGRVGDTYWEMWDDAALDAEEVKTAFFVAFTLADSGLG